MVTKSSKHHNVFLTFTMSLFNHISSPPLQWVEFKTIWQDGVKRSEYQRVHGCVLLLSLLHLCTTTSSSIKPPRAILYICNTASWE